MTAAVAVRAVAVAVATVALGAGWAREPGPPLTPGAGQARDWLERELADPAYDPGWLQRLWDTVVGVLTGSGPTGALPDAALTLLLMAVVAGLLLAAVALTRTIRRDRRDRQGRRATAGRAAGHFAGGPPGPADLRARAAAALGRSDWDLALLEAFRALAAEASAQRLLDASPGRTAGDVARAVLAARPADAATTETVAAAFARVRYGGAHVDEHLARTALDLAERLRRPSPASTGVP